MITFVAKVGCHKIDARNNKRKKNTILNLSFCWKVGDLLPEQIAEEYRLPQPGAELPSRA
jgi:hypothetical protein